MSDVCSLQPIDRAGARSTCVNRTLYSLPRPRRTAWVGDVDHDLKPSRPRPDGPHVSGLRKRFGGLATTSFRVSGNDRLPVSAARCGKRDDKRDNGQGVGSCPSIKHPIGHSTIPLIPIWPSSDDSLKYLAPKEGRRSTPATDRLAS